MHVMYEYIVFYMSCVCMHKIYDLCHVVMYTGYVHVQIQIQMTCKYAYEIRDTSVSISIHASSTRYRF